MYVGLSAGLQLLDVATFSLALHRNRFAHCSVNRSTGIRSTLDIYIRDGGNVYGGGVSIYIGGYSSSFNQSGVTVAAVGNTAVHNSSVRVETASFTSCSVSSYTADFDVNGGNSYGGSFSLYLGAYAWSASLDANSGGSSSSSSTSGSTTASGVSVFISNVNSSDSSATTTRGNSYGGSFSLYLGAYARVFESSSGDSTSADGRDFSISSSTSGLTTASGVSVFISNVNSSGCSATTTSSDGSNSYGGSFSLNLGAYAYSRGFKFADCSSVCGATNITGLVVSISSSTFANSSAASRAFHIAPFFSFPCAYSRSPAEFRVGNGAFGKFGSNVSAFVISTASIILP